MNRLLRAASERVYGGARDERGFTIPEISIAFLVSSAIVVAGLTFVLVSVGQWGDQSERVSSTDKARNGLLAMTSELRDATSVKVVNARTVDATVRNANGSLTNVRLACVTAAGVGSCTRTNLSTGAAETLVTGVTNTNNFATVSGSDVSGTTSMNGALQISLDVEIDDPTTKDDPTDPVSLVSTVKPRNCVTAPAAGVVNPAC